MGDPSFPPAYPPERSSDPPKHVRHPLPTFRFAVPMPRPFSATSAGRRPLAVGTPAKERGCGSPRRSVAKPSSSARKTRLLAARAGTPGREAGANSVVAWRRRATCSWRRWALHRFDRWVQRLRSGSAESRRTAAGVARIPPAEARESARRRAVAQLFDYAARLPLEIEIEASRVPGESRALIFSTSIIIPGGNTVHGDPDCGVSVDLGQLLAEAG